jgi:hypothetical protein
MITNDRFYETLGRIPTEERLTIRRRRNPKWIRKGERDLMFLEIPQNPMRIVERAAELARDHFIWEDVSWGINEDSCWVRPRWDHETKSYCEIIERDHPRHEAEVYAALNLLASVLRDRNT